MKLLLAGTGNLARHLGPLWHEAGHDLIGVWGRSAERSQRLIQHWKQCGDIDAPVVDGILACGPGSVLPMVDLILLAVPDQYIASASLGLLDQYVPGKGPKELPLICHTSGSAPLEELAAGFERRGVWYPLQTFSFADVLALPDFPVFLEGSAPSVLDQLKAWTQTWIPESKIGVMDSSTRLTLHLAAVLASNFPNYLWHRAFGILKQQGLDGRIMEPLVRKTMEKAFTLGPDQAQTGPARRKDLPTLDKHLELLEEDPELRELYRQLTILIQRSFS